MWVSVKTGEWADSQEQEAPLQTPASIQPRGSGRSGGGRRRRRGTASSRR
jgi:hypothetical protein